MITYNNDHVSAQARALYVIMNRVYGSYGAIARELGITKQSVHLFTKGTMLCGYAGFMGRKHGFDPRILCYEQFVLTMYKVEAADKYEAIVNACKILTVADKKYILGGSYIKDPNKFLRIMDSEKS